MFARTNLAQQVIEEVRKHFEDVVYETVIPRSIRLSEAPSFGKPIIDVRDPSGPELLPITRWRGEFLKLAHAAIGNSAKVFITTNDRLKKQGGLSRVLLCCSRYFSAHVRQPTIENLSRLHGRGSAAPRAMALSKENF